MNKVIHKYIKPVVPLLKQEIQKNGVLKQIVKETQQINGFDPNNKTMLKYWENNKNIVQFNQNGYEMVISRSIPDKKDRLESLRELGKQIAGQLLAQKIDKVDIDFNDLNEPEIGCVLNQIVLQNYKYKLTHDQDVFQPIVEINIKNQVDLKNSELVKQMVLAESNLYSRSLSNLRSNYGTTDMFKTVCKEIKEEYNNKVEIEVVEGQGLVDKGLNLIYNVGRGSRQTPMMIIMKYKGDQNSQDYVSVVGKGVVFDSGGVNLKPGSAMDDMHLDKTGACSAISVFKYSVQMGLKTNLIMGIGLVENMISDDCYRQTDIIQSYKGITVEIGNTDAEGRLVLADVMSYIQLNNQVKVMIEMSTLTGACLVALGQTTAGLFTNDLDLQQKLLDSAKLTNEPLWPLPINHEHREAIKSKNADIKNIGNRYGGSCTAASFLERFVEDGVVWAHIDIAGPSMVKVNDTAQSFGTQVVLDYLTKHQSA